VPQLLLQLQLNSGFSDVGYTFTVTGPRSCSNLPLHLRHSELRSRSSAGCRGCVAQDRGAWWLLLLKRFAICIYLLISSLVAVHLRIFAHLWQRINGIALRRVVSYCD